MITANLRKLEPEDVDDLYGLSLCMAFGIHVHGWKWYKRDKDGMKYVLVDTAPFKNRKLNKEFFRYMGDNRYVAKNLPKFDKRLKGMCNLAKNLEPEQQRIYTRWLEDEVKSESHFDLAHATSEQRCRAYLKMTLDEKRKKKCLVQSTEESS